MPVGLCDSYGDSIEQAVEPECEALVSGQVHPDGVVLGCGPAGALGRVGGGPESGWMLSSWSWFLSEKYQYSVVGAEPIRVAMRRIGAVPGLCDPCAPRLMKWRPDYQED
jgi:hypothetical protein